jgi:Domain of unknown function (DUF4880)
MILEKGGRVRLTPREFDLIRQSAALNGKTVNAITTLDELLAAVVDGLQPSMAADLLEFLEQRSAKRDSELRPTRRRPAKNLPRPTAEEAKRENAAARWLIERDDPDFSSDHQARFESWLNESDENRRMYEAMERAWSWALSWLKPN